MKLLSSLKGSVLPIEAVLKEEEEKEKAERARNGGEAVPSYDGEENNKEGKGLKQKDDELQTNISSSQPADSKKENDGLSKIEAEMQPSVPDDQDLAFQIDVD